MLARLLCPSEGVAAAFRRGAPAGGEEAGGGVLALLRSANRRSVVSVAGLALVPTVASLLGAPLKIAGDDLIALAIVVAVAEDLRAEIAARRTAPALACARPLHRVYALAPALQALSDAGIPAFARARHYRGLFHFFAPWAPIEILVAPDRAAEAEAIYARVEVG